MLRLVHTNYTPIVSDTRAVMASSFSRCAEYMNKYNCMFITAFRSEYTPSENRLRNKELEKDIKRSNLTFIKAHGGFVEDTKNGPTRVTEDTFCIVDNCYTVRDFIKLGVYWCKKYDQDAVLITTPSQDKTRNYALNITGTYYTKTGEVDMEFDHATVGDVDEYFTNICGKDFVLSSTRLYATTEEPFATINGARKASLKFKEKYPEL